jgi:hypothetical protein
LLLALHSDFSLSFSKARLNRLERIESEVAPYEKLTFKSTKMLTHMSTFDSLVAAKSLIQVVLSLPRGQFHERKIYAYPECVEWMKSVRQMVTGRVASDFTPQEQLVERLRQWMSGDSIVYDRMFHDMEPRAENVWEMKTADLRIFGWMYKPKVFVAVRGGYADDYKEPTKIKNYADDRNEVLKARDALPLDGEKFAEGDFDELV